MSSGVRAPTKYRQSNVNLMMGNLRFYSSSLHPTRLFADGIAKFKGNVRVILIACHDCLVFQTFDNKTFSIGHNRFGLMGCGYDYRRHHLHEIVELRGERLVESSCSGAHLLVRTASNKIYGWGSNMNGELIDYNVTITNTNDNNNNQNLTVINRPKLLYENAEDIKMFKCVDQFTILLKAGQIVIKGRETGLSCLFLPGNVFPAKVSDENRIEYFSCGKAHCFAVNVAGEAYGFGSNQMGSLNCANRAQPLAIFETGGRKAVIASIVCGDLHSVALTKDGDIHTFGSNASQQLGYRTRYTKKPRKVSVNNEIVEEVDTLYKVDGGVRIRGTIAKTIHGLSYVWGAVCCELQFYSDEMLKESKTDIFEPMATPFKSVKEAKTFYESPRHPFLMNRYPQVGEVVECVANMFNNQQYSDIQFVLGSSTLHLHRFVLRLNSAYMARMLDGQWRDESRIVVTGYRYRSFYAYLYFLYHGRIPFLRTEFIIELIRLAHDFGERELVDLCSELLCSRILDTDTACKLYTVARQYDLANVRAKASQLIKSRLNWIIKVADFKDFEPHFLKEIMLAN